MPGQPNPLIAATLALSALPFACAETIFSNRD
jgi:hypothetical protein